MVVCVSMLSFRLVRIYLLQAFVTRYHQKLSTGLVRPTTDGRHFFRIHTIQTCLRLINSVLTKDKYKTSSLNHQISYLYKVNIVDTTE